MIAPVGDEAGRQPMQVHAIAAEETHPLRLLVLRPGGRLEDCRWPIDATPEAFHLAVDDGNDRICVASFQPAAHGALPALRPWQLRGMATHPGHRGQGAGTLLMAAALERLERAGADVLWCNARLAAVPFYQRLGFRIEGALFDIPGIGPHHVMWRSI